MDFDNALQLGDKLATDFRCFTVNFPHLAEVSYGAHLRQIGFYRRLRAIHDALVQPLEIHHGACSREPDYVEPDRFLDVGGDRLNLASRYQVMRWKRQSFDWLIAISISDTSDERRSYRQANGIVIVRHVGIGEAFSPEVVNWHSQRAGFIYQGTMGFDESPVSNPTCAVPNVIYDNRAKLLNWVLCDAEHVETTLAESPVAA